MPRKSALTELQEQLNMVLHGDWLQGQPGEAKEACLVYRRRDLTQDEIAQFYRRTDIKDLDKEEQESVLEYEREEGIEEVLPPTAVKLVNQAIRRLFPERVESLGLHLNAPSDSPSFAISFNDAGVTEKEDVVEVLKHAVEQAAKRSRKESK